MIGFVVDASVLVARIRRNEVHHEEARAVLVMLADWGCAVHVPAIAFPEVAAAISRGGGNPRWAGQAVVDLLGLPGLQISAVDARLGMIAAQFAAQNRIRGCDAVYVALAQALGVSLITLDREQRERTPVTVTALTPAEVLADLSLA